MSNVSVTALGTNISINSQATKTFPTYTKTLVQFHRWNSTPPQFIYLDLHGSAPGGSSRVLAHMVVYGVKGYFPNVPSSVFDQVYVVDNGRLVLHADLDLHVHRLMNNRQGGFSFDSGKGVISMHENFNTNGYRVIGKNGGGFEVDADGRLKPHEDLDLNSHHVRGVLSLQLNDIKLNNDLDLNRCNLVSQEADLLGYNRDRYGDKILIVRPLEFRKPVTLPGMSAWVEGQVGRPASDSNTWAEFDFSRNYWYPLQHVLRGSNKLCVFQGLERAWENK